ESRSIGNVPVMHRGLPHRQEQRPLLRPGNGAKSQRREGRAKGGDADLGDRTAGRSRQDAEAEDARGLALVALHAPGGVALGVLDRAVALALGQFEIGDGDVVLEVDEVLVTVVVMATGGGGPEWVHWPRTDGAASAAARPCRRPWGERARVPLPAPRRTGSRPALTRDRRFRWRRRLPT